jgi:translocator protein
MELATRSELRRALVRSMAVVATIVVLFAALASKIGEVGRDQWFAQLAKPAFIPSPAAFTLWSSLVFLLLGLALAIVLAARGAHWRRAALLALGLCFALGLAWLPVTFGLRQLMAGTAIAGSAVLIGLVATLLSLRVRASAGMLMFLVTLWMGFCSYVSFSLWQGNAGAPISDPVNQAGTNTPFAQ